MNLEKIKPARKARIGLYAIGLHHYWGQFDGLLERLLGYNNFIAGELDQWGEVHNFGMVDTETKAQEAGEFFNAPQRRHSFLLRIHLLHQRKPYGRGATLPEAGHCTQPATG